jgi:hypothetical protein
MGAGLLVYSFELDDHVYTSVREGTTILIAL